MMHSRGSSFFVCQSPAFFCVCVCVSRVCLWCSLTSGLPGASRFSSLSLSFFFFSFFCSLSLSLSLSLFFTFVIFFLSLFSLSFFSLFHTLYLSLSSLSHTHTHSLSLSLSLSLFRSLSLSIYICCRVKTWSKKKPFFESKIGPSSLLFSFFVFFKNILLSAGRMRFFRKSEEKRQKLPFFESKLGPIMLRNILGPSFDATLDQVLTQPF